ncbi:MULTISPECIES: hypothetical protein [Methylophaga]|jgi:type II secretory pathway component GspD/PulD (secretin)|nr:MULTISPECIES: hypothetical protein [Methylophaga]HIC46853.1 hypothetical protein [Methylophaga sp.]
MKKSIIALLLVSLSGCAMPPEKEVRTSRANPVPSTVESAPRTSNFVSITTSKKQLMDERVTINNPKISVIDALTSPSSLSRANVIARDAGVNLAMKIGVKTQNAKIEDYISQVEGTTDYFIELQETGSDVTLYVSSVMTKSWDLAALSDMPTVETKSGFSATGQPSNNSGNAGQMADFTSNEASGTQLTTTRSDESWQSLIDDAKRIIGLEINENSDSSNSQNEKTLIPELGEGDDPIAMLNELGNRLDDEMNPYFIEPWVVGNKRIGKITAFGKPSQIHRLDEYLSRLSTQSQRQIYMEGAILDVKTTNGHGYGIDWSAVYANDDKTLSLSGSASQALSIVDGGTWSFAASIPFGDVTLNSVINSLREQGSVSVQSQPRLTITNGYTAYLGSTQEFSFVSNVEFLPLSTGNSSNAASDTAITTQLSRVNVGIKIAVTPKLLDNGKILVNIVPFLSTIAGTTPIKSAGEIYETPNIALQEMATQVITESGSPIYLGGLVVNRMLQNAKNLPIKNKALSKALGSASFEEENTELVIVVTPREVGA